MAKNHKNIIQMQLMKFDLFKSQNSETGRFDVIFEISGKLLYAHRNMLTLISDIFDSMLSERWTPNKDDPVKIKDYSYDDFYQFLVFLYFGECELTESNIFKMVDMAEFYGVQLFKEFCDEFLAAMEITLGNIFQLLDLADKYSMVQLKSSAHRFIIDNFQRFIDSDGFFNASKSFMDKIFTSVKDKIKPEDFFQAVYNWSEKRALDVQIANSNLNLNDQIKAEISPFLQYIDLKKMSLRFLVRYVVKRGFLFSYGQLSEILDNATEVKIKLTNSNGQSLFGSLPFESGAVEVIKSLKNCSANGNENQIWWQKRCKIPSTPSSIMKKDGIEWYLVYFCGSGNFGVEHSTSIDEKRYLLAEMIAESSSFDVTPNCKIEIVD